MLDNKRVLITGGTGSLGQAILKRAKQENWNTEFIIFSRSEGNQSQLKRQYPDYRYVLGDVGRIEDLERAMSGVDVIMHLAAYKQVPSSQTNVAATIRTNVIGSENVARCAVRYGVERVVATSTDKSPENVNYYGASKFLMEGIFQEANAWGDTVFTLARYGNVLLSRGSVGQLFERQKKEGGPLTVTSKAMTRFWLTLDQAVDIVLHALYQSPGVVTVPKAPASTMEALAYAIINSEDIDVVEIGIRPGEKIHECMINSTESMHTTQDENYFYIQPPQNDMTLYNTDNLFRYSSDTAPQLTVDELYRLIYQES